MLVETQLFLLALQGVEQFVLGQMLSSRGLCLARLEVSSSRAESRQVSVDAMRSTRPMRLAFSTVIGLPVNMSCIPGRTPQICTARTVPPNPG